MPKVFHRKLDRMKHRPDGVYSAKPGAAIDGFGRPGLTWLARKALWGKLPGTIDELVDRCMADLRDHPELAAETERKSEKSGETVREECYDAIRDALRGLVAGGRVEFTEADRRPGTLGSEPQ